MVFLCIAARLSSRGTAYWQDILPKPGVEWVGVCGRGDMSQLAFNINKNRLGYFQNSDRIAALEKRLAADEAAGDPNDAVVKEEGKPNG